MLAHYEEVCAYHQIAEQEKPQITMQYEILFL